jgi:hypothetical protein
MKILIEKHCEFNMETHIALVDFKKAFDRVSLKELLRILASAQVPQQTIQNIYNLYKTNLISVKIEDKLSRWREKNTGVRQECGLSPVLLIIYMIAIIKEFRQKHHGYIAINRNLQLDAMIFADDFLYNFKLVAEKYSMEISTEKTKIMAFCGKEPVPSKICLNNKILERVNECNYVQSCLLGYTAV